MDTKDATTLKVNIGGITFTAEMPGDGKTVEARYLAIFERWVVKMLCEFGEPSADGFRFLRTRSRVKAIDLAELLEVKPETVSRWENDKNEVSLSTWDLMVNIAQEHLAGRTDTLDRLRRRQENRRTQPKRLKMSSHEMEAARA